MSTAPSLTLGGPRATIRLARPERHNALGIDDIATLAAHLETVDANPRIRVLVLTAEGRSFCSGYDLSALAQEHGTFERAQAADEMLAGDPTATRFGALVDRLARMRIPTIAALGGSIYGGGTDLALACDLRVGTPQIQLRMTAARIGVRYYPSGLRRFVQRLGSGATKRIFLTAEPLDAAELLRIGYLDELVPPEALDARVAALAHACASNAPYAVQGTKRAIDAIADQRADDDVLMAAFHASLHAPELREGLAAYREKREPIFDDPTA